MNLESGSMPWCRSSWCGGESGCVEVASLADGTVGIHDAKLPTASPYLVIDRNAFRVFLAGVKAGEFGGV